MLLKKLYLILQLHISNPGLVYKHPFMILTGLFFNTISYGHVVNNC